MPNFDGKGPLKRGRVIGRGRGPCGKGGKEDEKKSLDNQAEQVKDQNAV